jgi:hypothetical protein
VDHSGDFELFDSFLGMWKLTLPALPGWAVYEVEMFTSSDCSSGRLSGEIIASGYAPPIEDGAKTPALDGCFTMGGSKSPWV